MDQFPVQEVEKYVNEHFDKDLPVLIDLLKIPSQSRAFDPQYLTNGLLNQTCEKCRDYITSLGLKGATIELVQDEGLSPFMFVEVQGSDENAGTVLFYGHMDKQPPFTGWREGLSAYEPKIEDDKLYARGGADDTYSVFGAGIAVKACQDLGLKHPRIVMTFEADEESGSAHIDHYLKKFEEKIGKVDVVFCLDSGCGNFDQLWLTTTLRGMVSTVVTVKVLNEGVHSGDASGVVPSSFRILRQLLDRIDNPETGEVVEDFQVNIPGERYLQAYKTSEILGNTILQKFPFHGQTKPTSSDPFKAYINRIWKAQLSIVGADGLPLAATAGNVLRPQTSLKLSIRLPPTKDCKEAVESLRRILTTNVPYNATVELSPFVSGNGFNAPPNKPYLDEIIQSASQNFFKREALTFGEGGSIPLMGDLMKKYPEAQFVVTGVLGPNSNAHGPNEFLHIPFTKKLIASMAQITAQCTNHLRK